MEVVNETHPAVATRQYSIAASWKGGGMHALTVREHVGSPARTTCMLMRTLVDVFVGETTPQCYLQKRGVKSCLPSTEAAPAVEHATQHVAAYESFAGFSVEESNATKRNEKVCSAVGGDFSGKRRVTESNVTPDEAWGMFREREGEIDHRGDRVVNRRIRKMGRKAPKEDLGKPSVKPRRRGGSARGILRIPSDEVRV